MSQKTIKRLGWTLTIVLALLFALSSFLKLMLHPTAVTQAVSLGFDTGTYRLLGVFELIILILFIFPRTGIIGSLLLIAYMGGAIASHLQHQQPVGMAIIIQMLVWIATAFRFPDLVEAVIRSARK